MNCLFTQNASDIRMKSGSKCLFTFFTWMKHGYSVTRGKFYVKVFSVKHCAFIDNTLIHCRSDVHCLACIISFSENFTFLDFERKCRTLYFFQFNWSILTCTIWFIHKKHAVLSLLLWYTEKSATPSSLWIRTIMKVSGGTPLTFVLDEPLIQKDIKIRFA